ncbi:MAG: hypothetical protein OQK77_03250, partial [Psychromonas sp.]|nr:hypothetical protein [Psychromonas sp.]
EVLKKKQAEEKMLFLSSFYLFYWLSKERYNYLISDLLLLFVRNLYKIFEIVKSYFTDHFLIKKKGKSATYPYKIRSVFITI